MTLRTKLFWAIWLIVVILVMWMVSKQAMGSQHIWVVRPSIQSPKGCEQAVPSRITLPMVIIILPSDPDVEFFSATAYNEYGESDFSNEVAFTNSLNKSFIDLAWSSSASTNVSGYRIHSGWYSGQYTNVYDAGTNLSVVVPIYGWPLTNWSITVTATNGATNIVRSSSTRGPWTNLNSISWTATNPVSPLFFRGIGKSGNRVLIGEKRF